MAKPAARILFLEAVLVLAGAAVIARSFWLQVVNHGVWVSKAGVRRGTDVELNARRGRILDRVGNPLAVSQEQYHLSISLDLVTDTAGLQARLPRLLGVSKARVDEQFRRDFPYFDGPFRAEQVDPIRRVPGVNLEVLYNRVYPVPNLADRVLGRVNGDTGIEGMEKALDTLLQGHAGRARYLVDARGRRLPAPGAPIIEAAAGNDVELTIDSDLQGIAERALQRAVIRHKAHGGEIVIMDVATGELYAVASLRTDPANDSIVSAASALLEPNEPGSTSKLFTVAAILRTGADTTPVEGEGGEWNMPFTSGGATRLIKDVHPIHGLATLGETVKVSSNIAISKFALRLKPQEQFEAIRDFGFGISPSTGFPAEANGRLRIPAKWENDKLSMTSLAQGYEWEATAVQLAAGYGAIANHGVLMAPTLVRRVRNEHGAVIWEHRPDTVRQAVHDSVARHLLEYLRLTEDSGGTGEEAQLDVYGVAGKTGTAKRRPEIGGGYRSSYVGLFPDDRPQVVIYIMIDRALTGGIYGGKVAAPMVREVMQQALVARVSPLDRSRLLTTAAVAPPRAQAVALPPTRRVSLPAKPNAAARDFVAVPDVVGLSARQAVVALERAGFQIRLMGRSLVRTTAPAAGDSLLRGTTITVRADSLR